MRQYSKYTKSLEEEVLQLYKDNMQVKEICRVKGVYKDYPTIVAKKYGVMRGQGRSNDINPILFRPGTPASDYWLGYLVSDGNVNYNIKNRSAVISLFTIDEEIKNKYLAYVPGCNLHMQTDTLHKLYFGSIVVCKQLIELGIVPNKSCIIELNFPINNNVFRGIFDGDGSVHNKKACVKITTGSVKLGNQITEYLSTVGIYSKLRIRKGTKTYDVWIERLADFRKLFDLMYTDIPKNILMERKYKKYKQTLKIFNLI